jgi:hypothetical protein
MGGKTTPSRAVVQSTGQGLRLKAEFLEQEFNQAGPVLIPMPGLVTSVGHCQWPSRSFFAFRKAIGVGNTLIGTHLRIG